MQRNLSDLSQRIKKRVTYRLLSLNDQSSLVKQNPSGPKRQRSASVDSADTGLCDTKNHTEEVSENEDQPIIIKDPPPPKKNFPDYMVKKVQTKIRNALQNQKYRW